MKKLLVNQLSKLIALALAGTAATSFALPKEVRAGDPAENTTNRETISEGTIDSGRPALTDRLAAPTDTTLSRPDNSHVIGVPGNSVPAVVGENTVPSVKPVVAGGTGRKPAVRVSAKPRSSGVGPATKGRVVTRKQGMASWYGPGFHGNRTASGERFNSGGYTAAHRYLPFGTRVRVTNARTGRSVVVRINDRGPFSGGRVIDLSKGAARAIGVFRSGVAPVLLEVLGR